MGCLYRNKMNKRIFGIRHLSPACAKALRLFLDDFSPDILLLEAPDDMEDALRTALPPVTPPVAVMAYTQEMPHRSVLLPLAGYSPEYIALRYAAERELPLRCIDMPSFFFADRQEKHPAAAAFSLFALRRGEKSFEDAWERAFEHTGTYESFFEETARFGHSLREDAPPNGFTLEREAYMRAQIARAEREGFHKIAVVCGAYHAPALSEEGGEEPILPSPEPMRLSLIPYSYQRLSHQSGYGGGNGCPRYYEMLYRHGTVVAQAEFLTETGSFIREQGGFVSTADIQDAVLLARSLGSFHGGKAVYRDLCDAARTCFARQNKDSALLETAIFRYGAWETLGIVPGGEFSSPLTQDFQNTVTELHLTATDRITLRLHTGKENGLDDRRSRFLHLLRVLDLPCAVLLPLPDGTSGLREDWSFRPDAETFHSLVLLPASSLSEAAALAVASRPLTRLRDVTRRLEDLMLADLPGLLPETIETLDQFANEPQNLEEPLGALLLISRFISDYRPHSFDTETLSALFTRLMHRCRAILSAGCGSDEESVRKLLPSLPLLHRILSKSSASEWLVSCRGWQETARPLFSGCVTGFLLETDRDMNHLQKIMLRVFADPEAGRQWMEGLLFSGRRAVLYDTALWQTIKELWDNNPPPARLQFSLRRALFLLTPEERTATPFAGLEADEESAVLLPLGSQNDTPFKTLSETVRWLRDVRPRFTSVEFLALQRDAMQHPDFLRHIQNPAVLELIEPDGMAAGQLLSRPIPSKSAPAARRLLERWVDNVLPPLERLLAQDPRLSSNYSVNRKRLDLKRIVRHNIRLYDKQTESILPAKLFFARPLQAKPLPALYLLLDSSGSMTEQSLWGALIGCALLRFPGVKTRLFSFAEQTRELTTHGDPLETLLSMPRGGGTDLTGALRYVGREIPAPARAHLLLFSDLLDGGDPKELLESFTALQREGLRITLLLSVTGRRHEYNTKTAEALQKQGIRCLSLSLEEEADWADFL